MNYHVNTAKLLIDEVYNNKHNYKNNNRVQSNVCAYLRVLPCIMYSLSARCARCPFNIFFNKETRMRPCKSCIIDSKSTINSDSHIYNAFTECNQRIRVPYHYYSREEMNSIIKYAAEKISSTDDIKLKYAIADCICYVAHDYFINITPDDIVNYNGQLQLQ